MADVESLKIYNHKLDQELFRLKEIEKQMSKDLYIYRKQKEVFGVWLDYKKLKNSKQIKKSHKRNYYGNI